MFRMRRTTIAAIIVTATLMSALPTDAFAQKRNKADLIVTGNALKVDNANDTSRILARSDSSITFTVDSDLPEPDGPRFSIDGSQVITSILNDREIEYDKQNIIASSFSDEKFVSYNRQAFFRGMIDAFAGHYPLVLTPDAVWLVICQGFAHYVNDDPEAVRSFFVDHEGQAQLVVRSEWNLMTDPDSVDWTGILQGFEDQLRSNTKNGVADMMLADFSTTGPTEKIVSQATLMESMKAYFEYVVMYLSCGIPSITLKGTTEDWEKILAKSQRLSEFGLDWWARDLEPVLAQFVAASKGQVDLDFWRSIVKKYHPDELRGGGCSMETPTSFDGWFLKLMPFDRHGRTPATVTASHEMMPQVTSTPFKYIVFNDFTGVKEAEYDMELCAGIVGMQQDPGTMALTPRLGWFVRVEQTQEEMLEEMKSKNEMYGLELKVTQVPEILRQLGHIRSLSLDFLGRVEIPEWFDSLSIDNLSISGQMSDEEAAALRARFPKARINGQSASDGQFMINGLISF